MNRYDRRTMLERPVMRESFRKELRSRLLSEAAVVLAPRARRPLLSWTVLRPAFAVAALALIVAWGATSAAAASLPGDPLYGLKRASENVQLALTFDDVSRMQLLSQFADRRLDELAQIAQQHPAAAPTATSEYADAVEKFKNAVDQLRNADSEDKREAAEAVAEAAREKHIAVLEAVKDKLPPDEQPEVQQVIERQQQLGSPGDRGGGNDKGGGRPSASPRSTPKK